MKEIKMRRKLNKFLRKFTTLPSSLVNKSLITRNTKTYTHIPKMGLHVANQAFCPNQSNRLYRKNFVYSLQVHFTSPSVTNMLQKSYLDYFAKLF